ncbi:hypothetical protein G7Z17_g6857 [Cylindrodendrum hubeiense]|uniref:Uncharacterized protein n=1 Tax=Cylindrodendrum hubeiense TaxID=595255 RepID=A0A9P5HA54_9HYPO|nr:hypothetical protein G7Z17_g6857 [Cylindrodendrum hubeiense]
MSASNAGESNSSDLVDLTSNIGTWVGATIGIIALVGVIAPFLAIQASLSDNNRAMNAVQDLPQKYVTRGYRLTKGLRVLRRIRVPDLSPGYITNAPDTTRLVPLRAALGRWVLRPRDYLPWNTGWAKLAEVIEAYEVRDAASNSPVELGVKGGGTLEVVNSRTALVVNKHWILLLGLLGRYGKRRDKGVLQRTGIRRDFEGERASIRHFELQTEEKKKEKKVMRESTAFEWVRKKKDSRPWSPTYHGSRSSDTSSDESSFDESDSEVISLRRSAYGEWTLDKKVQSKIHGATGTMQDLGRHKGSWSYLTSISFVPHTARETFAPGTLERVDKASIQTLFWLANGFLPCGRTTEGRQTVISMESPAGEIEASDQLFRDHDSPENLPAFSLQESLDIPMSMGNAMKCLGIPEPKVLQFLPIHTSSSPPHQRGDNEPGTSDGKRLDRNQEDHSASGDEKDTPRIRSTTLRIRGPWVHYSKYVGEASWVFLRKDLERPLAVLLGLDWDDWGFLIQKDQFWISILKNATAILKQDTVREPAFAGSLGLTSQMKAFRWIVRSKFHPQKLADYMNLDQFLSTSVQESEVLPLRLALGTLFIMDASFRGAIEKVCERLSKNTEDHSDDRPESEKLAEEKELLEDLENIEKDYWKKIAPRSEEKDADSDASVSNDDEAEVTEETWTRFSLRHLDIATLELFRIEYELDADPTGVMIKRWVPEWEQNILWDHTAKSRALAERRKEDEEKRVGVLEYEYTSKQLKWYLDEKTKTDSRSWHLNEDLVRAPSSERTVVISENEIVLVGLWAANRAALWLSSQDSKPLLDFIEDLDPHVYVL